MGSDKDIGDKMKQQTYMYLPPPSTDETDEKFESSPKIDQKDWPSLVAKKFSRNPFVPVGLTISIVGLVRGVYFGLLKKNMAKSNKMMQVVVGGQILSFGSIVIEKTYTDWKRGKEAAEAAAQRQSDNGSDS